MFLFYKKLFYDRQCSVFISASPIISVTLFSIHSMALLGPRKVYFTGISRPHPLPLFTLLPLTSQLMVQFEILLRVTEFISEFIFITLNSWKDNWNVYKFSSRRKHSNVFRNSKFFLCDASNIQALFCKVKMAMSKYQLAGSLEKKTLALQEKIKFLDYAEANEKLGC